MIARYPDNSTDAQLKAIAGFNASRLTMLGIIRTQLADARVDADIKLPAKNEHGESVLHGCRKDMYDLIDLYENMIRELLSLDGNDRLVKHGGMALETDGKWAR